MKIQIFHKDDSAAIMLRTQDGKHVHQLMGEDIITFKTTLPEPHEFAIGDFLVMRKAHRNWRHHHSDDAANSHTYFYFITQ